MKPNGTALTATSLEAQVVGALLAGGADALLDLPPAFGPAALLAPDLRKIFGALQRLAERKALPSGPVDRDLLIAEAGLTDGERKTLTLAEESAGLDRRTVREYAAALLDRHRRGALIAALGQASRALSEGSEATTDIAARLTTTLLDLDRPDRPESLTYREALLSTIDAVDAVKSKRAPVLRTGLEGLDRILRIRPGNLVVLAARPKIGKSTLARQIARAVALRRQHVLWHGLEMDAPETIALDLSAGATVDSMEFFDDDVGFDERAWAAITAAADRMLPAESEGYIHANHYHHALGAICRITEKLHRKHGLALVIVDYLQLVQLDLGRNATRENVVATISRTLKLLAMRLGVPVLALSQLNRESAKRGAEGRGKKRRDPMAIDGQAEETPRAPPPQLQDLRESGAIEQDANAVVFLHHPFDASTNEWQRRHGPFDLIVAAQRLGPTGTVHLIAERKYSRFKETA